MESSDIREETGLRISNLSYQFKSATAASFRTIHLQSDTPGKIQIER